MAAGSLARALPSGKVLALGFAVVAAIVGGYAAARGTSMFAVQEIEVRGASPRVVARVEHALAPLRDESLLSVDAADVERALVHLPDVEPLGLDRHYPATLRVRVTAERPVAVLRRGPDAWLVSERGRILRPLPDRRPTLIPRIWVAALATPRDGTVLTKEEALKPALALGVVFAADRRLFGRVREARARGSAVDLILRNGVELRLGSLHDLALKLAAAREVLKRLGNVSSGYIDLSAPDRPVAAVESQVSA